MQQLSSCETLAFYVWWVIFSLWLYPNAARLISSLFTVLFEHTYSQASLVLSKFKGNADKKKSKFFLFSDLCIIAWEEKSVYWQVGMPHKCVLKGKTKHGKHSCNPVYYISQCICLFWSIITQKQEFKLTLNIKSCKTQEIKALDVHRFIYNLIRTWLWFLHGLRWLSQILKPIFFFQNVKRSKITRILNNVHSFKWTENSPADSSDSTVNII